MDPGHGHGINTPDNQIGPGPGPFQVPYACTHQTAELIAKTGISIENLPARSAVSVSIDINDAGEHLPLVYVLICQKVA
jgi:hypothetical protein